MYPLRTMPSLCATNLNKNIVIFLLPYLYSGGWPSVSILIGIWVLENEKGLQYDELILEFSVAQCEIRIFTSSDRALFYFRNFTIIFSSLHFG